MTDQGISNRESPQEERRERDEFPPRDPGLREHNKRSDEKSDDDLKDDDEIS